MAAVGASFAVLFPLLKLPAFLGGALKTSVGLLLPLLASAGRGGGRKKRTPLVVVAFFAFTFTFAGALLFGESGVFGERLPPHAVGILFLAFLCVGARSIERLYRRRAVARNIYPCVVRIGEKQAKTDGFWDSGNLATKEGVPVCFLSADILYDLCGDSLIFPKERGQVCDEMQICTQSGEKTIPVYRGQVRVETGGESSWREVYFARATNMIQREYKLILHSRSLEE